MQSPRLLEMNRLWSVMGACIVLCALIDLISTDSTLKYGTADRNSQVGVSSLLLRHGAILVRDGGPYLR